MSSEKRRKRRRKLKDLTQLAVIKSTINAGKSSNTILLLIPLSTLPRSFTRETSELIYTSNKVWYIVDTEQHFDTVYDKHNMTWTFRITCHIYPLPISSLELKFSR